MQVEVADVSTRLADGGRLSAPSLTSNSRRMRATTMGVLGQENI